MLLMQRHKNLLKDKLYKGNNPTLLPFSWLVLFFIKLVTLKKPHLFAGTYMFTPDTFYCTVKCSKSFLARFAISGTPGKKRTYFIYVFNTAQ